MALLIRKSVVALAAAWATLSGMTPALAGEGSTGEITLTGEVSLASDYRFRGVSYSDGDLALQGGITATHASGFYLGTWSSSVAGDSVYGSHELDLFAGWSGRAMRGLTVDAGLIHYAYPGGDAGAANYFEAYASLSGTLGAATASLGVVYAWEQASQGEGDNRYLYADVAVIIPHTPVTLSGHLGYTNGVQAPAIIAAGDDNTGMDWSLGASATLLGPLSLSFAYVGVQGPRVRALTDDTVVATLSASF